MLLEPRILVVAAGDELVGPLCQGLDSLGWPTLTARTSEAAAQALKDFRFEAVILDVADSSADELASRLRAEAQPRHLPILLIGDKTQDVGAHIDLVMFRFLHPVQTALRLDHLTRAGIAEEEFLLRQQTFAAHGVELIPPALDDHPLQVLTVGKPDRRFIALSNALVSMGAEVVAAPTPFTAFDYLHERAFDAVVLWADEDTAPALSIVSGMKRNTRLYHIPLTLYLKQERSGLHELFIKGFADVAEVDTSEEEMAERVVALARNYRRGKAIRTALDSVRGSSLVDASTGLFTPELFAAHLGRLAKGAHRRGRPICVCVLRVAARNNLNEARRSGFVQAAMTQVGAMISRLVRVEDTAARLGSEVFALILPAVSEAEARLAAGRIAAVIGCTAFDAGEGRPPFVVELEMGIGQARPDESAAVMLERAMADLAR